MSNMWLDCDTFESMAGVEDLNITTYNYNGTVVPNSGSITLNLPLFGFFKASKIAPCALKGPILLRVYFNASSYYIVSGAEMSASAMTLLVHGRTLKANVKSGLISTYNNGRVPLSLSHLSVDRQSITLNLTPSQTVRLNLTGLTGICAFIVFTVKCGSKYTC